MILPIASVSPPEGGTPLQSLSIYLKHNRGAAFSNTVIMLTTGDKTKAQRVKNCDDVIIGNLNGSMREEKNGNQTETILGSSTKNVKVYKKQRWETNAVDKKQMVAP